MKNESGPCKPVLKTGKLSTMSRNDTVKTKQPFSADNSFKAGKTAPLQSNNLARDGKMGKAA